MNPGIMTERLRLYRPQKSEGRGFGSYTGRRYEELPRLEPAYLVRQTGRMRMEGGELFSAYDAEFKVYAWTPVREFWRVRHEGQFGHLYEVKNVMRDSDPRFVKLQCSKVNE